MKTDFEYLANALVIICNEHGNTPLTPALLIAAIQMAEQEKYKDQNRVDELDYYNLES